MRPIRIGTALDTRDELLRQYSHDPEVSRFVELTLKDLERHGLITGPTGSGKSRLIQHLVLNWFLQGNGAAVLDIHGHTAEDIAVAIGKLALDCERTEVFKAIHYHEFTPWRCARIDPARFDAADIHRDFRESAFAAWSVAAADSFAAILQRGALGDSSMDGQPRLHRHLRDLFIACCTLIKGKHLPLSCAWILLDFTHVLHPAVWKLISPHLPREVRADFIRLKEMRRDEEVLRQIESAINRLRSFFTPPVAAALSSDGTDQLFDWYHTIQHAHLVCVDARMTPYLSHQQGVALVGFAIRSIVETMMKTPREKIRPFLVVVEEAGEIITPDEEQYLGACRKYGTMFLLCGQDGQTFRK